MLYRGSDHRYLKRFVKGRVNETKIGRYSLASHRSRSVVVNLCIPQRSLCPWLEQRSGDDPLHCLQRIGVAWTRMAAAVERMRCHDERHCVSRGSVFLARNNSGRCLGRGKYADQCASTDRWSQFSRAFRGNLEQVVSSLPQHARALIPGMSLGDDHQASAQMRNDMKTVSFAHLTAVSGAHMSILLMTIALLTPRKKTWKLVVQLAVLLLFVALVGPQASVLRSFGVSIIAFGGMWLNREGGIYSSLSTVVIAACLLSPFDACSLGFCLSVLATWGVSVPARWISHAGEKAGVAAENAWIPRMSALLAIPLGAQIATLPVMISMNSWIGLWSIPAQILISPFVTPVTIASFAAALSAQLYAPIGFVCAWIASWGTAWIAGVARLFSSLPGARVSLGNNAGIFAVGAGISVALIVAARLRRFTTSRPLERVTLGGES